MKGTVIFLILLIAAITVDPAFIVVSTFKIHDPGAISFGASLNATSVAQGQTITVTLQTRNTAEFKNTVSLSEGSHTTSLSSNPCAGLFPGGVAVYQGVYGLNNVSSAKPLPFNPPDDVYNCWILPPVSNSFTFKPHQDIEESIDLPGYYSAEPADSSNPNSGVLLPYQPGVYTVIAGDPLGSTLVLHFRVTGTTGRQERSGPVSTFPASWASPCGSSSNGNTTTGVYLDLNGSSDFDHININSVYQQVIDNPTFAYDTVGHGWVVSEWFGIEASNDPADGQVVAAFIQLNGSLPIRYLDAYYQPDGGVSVALVALYPSSCPS